MTPAFLSHRAVNASGPTAPISSKSVLPYVFQVFSDKGNRCSPYSGGLSVTVSPCMTGDYDPNDASLLCTAYEEALEDYLWQVAGGRESGARRRLPPTQALEQKSRTSSKYAKSDFTRRRDERSLPPSIPIHEATVHGKITAVAMCPFNRLLAVASISNFSTIIQMYDILNPPLYHCGLPQGACRPSTRNALQRGCNPPRLLQLRQDRQGVGHLPTTPYRKQH
eukprot:TRINITY_DN49424_c0_g1_i2.p2 TRINITY_DN49424_c0_g1~~TRINITY_DN49424_c0_g1_i2.p2  ORF type:complete len:223 (-),score=20.41 TRINITY_DN49424_c0_g1_i2:825-1493(-)